ncbi:LysE family translocator [Marinomonas epiphytica]
MSVEIFIVYCAVAFFYIISPGPAVFLAIYNGALHGTRRVVAAALGNILGLLILSSLSISGLSAVLMASSSLFTLVKVVGAVYLVYLGIKQFRAKPNAMLGVQSSPCQVSHSMGRYFREGFVVAVTNPKPIIFFAALFPQFLTTEQAILPQFMIMTGMFMLFSFLSLFTYGYLGKKAKHFLSDNRRVQWFQRISGGLFVGMGISLFGVKSAS